LGGHRPHRRRSRRPHRPTEAIRTPSPMTDRDDIRTRLGRLLMRWDQLDHQDTFDIDLLHHAVDSIELRHHWRTLTPAEIADRVRWFQDHAHRGGPSGMAIEHPTFTPTQTD